MNQPEKSHYLVPPNDLPTFAALFSVKISITLQCAARQNTKIPRSCGNISHKAVNAVHVQLFDILLARTEKSGALGFASEFRQSLKDSEYDKFSTASTDFGSNKFVQQQRGSSDEEKLPSGCSVEVVT